MRMESCLDTGISGKVPTDQITRKYAEKIQEDKATIPNNPPHINLFDWTKAIRRNMVIIKLKLLSVQLQLRLNWLTKDDKIRG